MTPTIKLHSHTAANPAAFESVPYLFQGLSDFPDRLAEYAGRLCYRSDANMSHSPDFIAGRIAAGHEDIIEHVAEMVNILMTEEDPELEAELTKTLRSNLDSDRKLARHGKTIIAEMVLIQKLEVIFDVLAQGVPNGRAHLELAFAQRMHAIYERAEVDTARSVLLQGVGGFQMPSRG